MTDDAENMTMSNLTVSVDLTDLTWGDLQRFVQLATDADVADSESVTLVMSPFQDDVVHALAVTLSRKADLH